LNSINGTNRSLVIVALPGEMGHDCAGKFLKARTLTEF
jgi:hypothetical protein